jgi:hypothetical protein
MRRTTILAALTAAILTLPARATSTSEGFQNVLEPYEAVRRALVHDDLAVAKAPAEALESAIQRIRENPTASAAGVPSEKLGEIEALLPELEEAAGELANATELQPARDAFYALSKALVRWRQAAGEGPAVVYCAMKKRSWLQSDENEIGNPYYGQDMPSCGEVVSK